MKIITVGFRAGFYMQSMPLVSLSSGRAISSLSCLAQAFCRLDMFKPLQLVNVFFV